MNVGIGAVIGAGSVVVKNVEENMKFINKILPIYALETAIWEKSPITQSCSITAAVLIIAIFPMAAFELTTALFPMNAPSPTLTSAAKIALGCRKT